MEELTVVKVNPMIPDPSPPEPAVAPPEMKSEPAPDVSKVIVEVEAPDVCEKLNALVAPREESTAIVTRPLTVETVEPPAK